MFVYSVDHRKLGVAGVGEGVCIYSVDHRKLDVARVGEGVCVFSRSQKT